MEELSSLNFEFRKLKWLQIHEKKVIFWPQAAAFKAFEISKNITEKVLSHPVWERANDLLLRLKVKQRAQFWGNQFLQFYSRVRPRLISVARFSLQKLQQIAGTVYRLSLKGSKRGVEKIKHRISPPKPQEQKVFVPHLTSSDQPEKIEEKQLEPAQESMSEQLPLFQLKDRDNN